MIEGFWCMVVGRPESRDGAGVVLFRQGRILGGDSTFYFEGEYLLKTTRDRSGNEIKDRSFEGKVHVTNFGSTTPSRFGEVAEDGSFDVLIEGWIDSEKHIVGNVYYDPPDGRRQMLPVHLWKKAMLA